MRDPFERENESAKRGDFEKRRRAVDTVRSFMKKSDDYRRPFLELASKARELYECWTVQSKSVTQRANLKLPYAYQVIEAEAPQLCEIFLKEKPYFRLKGRSVDDMQFQDDLTDFCSMQMDRMEFAPKFASFVKGLLIDGTAIAKIPYKYKEQIVIKRGKQIDPFLGVEYPTKEQVLEVLYDGPDMEHIALEDFFPDWSVHTPADIENMRGAVHRTRKTLSELRSQGVYKQLDELEHSINTKGTKAWNDPYYKGEYDRNRSEEQIKDEKKKPVEVWEYWGLFDVSGKGDFVEYIIAVANGDVVIRCEENFYDYKLKPFAAAVNVLRDGEFYGVSELFAVRSLIKEATALRNSRLDQINLAINRMWIVDRGAGINAKALYSRPSGIIYANDINGIKPLDPPEVPPSSYRELGEITNEIQTTVANQNGPNLSEAGRVFGRSATGASMVSAISSSRVGLKARLISATFMKRVARVMLMTNAQYVSEDQWIRVSDPNRPNPFTMLPQSAFHCEYDFEIGTTLEIDPAQQAQKMQMAVQFFQTAEATQPGTIKWDVVFEAIGRDLLGREAKRFVRSEEERQMMLMQQMAGEQAASAIAGQAAPQPNKKI